MSSSKNQPLQPGHESPSSDEDATGSFYAMHFGGDGGLLMRQGTGSPSPMALMVMRAVGQMVQRKKACGEVEADEGGNNSHEGSTAAAGGSADALVSAVKSDTQNDLDDVEHDGDGTGACGSHVDTAETEETNSAKKKKKKNKRDSKKTRSKKTNKS